MGRSADGEASDGLVDLRSDTVTRPTAEMRRAMASAEVGDDAYGEDPTVNALEERFAALVGKDAALFVPSGTMANQLAVRVLARPGTTVVAGSNHHVVAFEHGATARNAGVQFHTVADDDGTVAPEAVAWAVEAARHHRPSPSLLWLENTHMAAGGVPLELAGVVEAAAAADGMAVHMDGARLFNAVVATATPAAGYAAPLTTVMSCLSKGLCAPVGSLLAGPSDVIAAARDERAVLGGAMRQAGVLAAAGLVALSTMVERLVEDHDRAAFLAGAVVDRWPRCGLDPCRVSTNVVIFSHAEAERLLDHLRGAGILAGTVAPGRVRLVTHRDVDDAGAERARRAIAAAP